MSYKKLVHRVAEKLGRSFFAFSIPYNFFFVSKHWLSLLGGVPLALGALTKELDSRFAFPGKSPFKGFGV